MIPIGIGLKTYYSIQHIQAAAYLARRAGCIEEGLTCDSDPIGVSHKAYVTSALFSTVAFLEAQINELYADADQPHGGHLNTLNKSIRASIAAKGHEESTKKASPLEKYDLLLSTAGIKPISTGCSPGQDVTTIILLRNELTHYKASLFDVGTEGMTRPGNFGESKFPARIKGKFQKRKNSTGMSGDTWLSHGLTTWAIKSAIDYADSFFLALGIRPMYDHIREKLSTQETPSDA